MTLSRRNFLRVLLAASAVPAVAPLGSMLLQADTRPIWERLLDKAGFRPFAETQAGLEYVPTVAQRSTLAIYDGAGEILSSIVMPVPPPASKGTLTFETVHAPIMRTGRAGSFALLNPNGVWVVRGTCGEPGDFADLMLNTRSLIAGDPLSVDVSITLPGGAPRGGLQIGDEMRDERANILRAHVIGETGRHA